MSKPLIELRNINKHYRIGGEEQIALHDVNLQIQAGEFIAIMGPSGSGKSTMMNILGLLDTPTSGQYILNGTPVEKLSGGELARIRNQEIGFVFQQFNLLSRTSVLDNVLLPSIYGRLPQPRQRAEEVIAKVGLSDRIQHRSNQLSGGQIQRVAIARALLMQPSLILADEPTGNLDTKRSEEVMKLFQEINAEGKTIIVITHEDEIAAYAQRVIRIRDGEIQ